MLAISNPLVNTVKILDIFKIIHGAKFSPRTSYGNIAWPAFVIVVFGRTHASKKTNTVAGRLEL
ncbi:MAG: hypothetical protein CMM76_14750 [Rhodospirillaceae bacterium]|nr:hypothetical protein [Rhodospirillaceae bacterium]